MSYRQMIRFLCRPAGGAAQKAGRSAHIPTIHPCPPRGEMAFQRQHAPPARMARPVRGSGRSESTRAAPLYSAPRYTWPRQGSPPEDTCSKEDPPPIFQTLVPVGFSPCGRVSPRLAHGRPHRCRGPEDTLDPPPSDLCPDTSLRSRANPPSPAPPCSSSCTPSLRPSRKTPAPLRCLLPWLASLRLPVWLFSSPMER